MAHDQRAPGTTGAHQRPSAPRPRPRSTRAPRHDAPGPALTFRSPCDRRPDRLRPRRAGGGSLGSDRGAGGPGRDRVVAVLVVIPLRGLYRFTGGTMEEGFMLYFPERMAKGDVPNVDFLHLYGPGPCTC